MRCFRSLIRIRATGSGDAKVFRWRKMTPPRKSFRGGDDYETLADLNPALSTEDEIIRMQRSERRVHKGDRISAAEIDDDVGTDLAR